MQSIIDVKHPSGAQKAIILNTFPAMVGWQIQREFFEFAKSHRDQEYCKAYTMKVLSFASVVLGKDNEIQLLTNDVIDNHLGSWENVELVFNALLEHNGIDPKTHAEKENLAQRMGGEMALGFMAGVSEMMKPMLALLNKTDQQ